MQSLKTSYDHRYSSSTGTPVPCSPFSSYIQNLIIIRRTYHCECIRSCNYTTQRPPCRPALSSIPPHNYYESPPSYRTTVELYSSVSRMFCIGCQKRGAGQITGLLLSRHARNASKESQKTVFMTSFFASYHRQSGTHKKRSKRLSFGGPDVYGILYIVWAAFQRSVSNSLAYILTRYMNSSPPPIEDSNLSVF